MVAAPLAVCAGEIVPHGASLQVIVHEAPALAKSFMTVAVKACVPPTLSAADAGLTETEIAFTVTEAEAVLVASITEVAVTLTL